MATPITFALNHIVSPHRKFADFAKLTRDLGITAVEIRNDLQGVEIIDGTSAEDVKAAADAAGVEILSINALQRFNEWNPTREQEAAALARYAATCGAKALVLCPVNSVDDRRSETQRVDDLRRSLQALRPILRDHGLTGLIEPLGFEECSLRLKRVAVDAIDAVEGADTFKVLHDTFHHYLANEREIFPERTGLVHISGVEDRSLAHNDIRDQHRILVGEGDLLGNIAQIKALRQGGYRGLFSFEPFASSVHDMTNVADALRQSIALISGQVSS
jgi:2-keto-myo-inositol isomerase